MANEDHCDAQKRFVSSGDSWIMPTKMADLENPQDRLKALQQEHRDLDDVIERLAESVPFDQLRMQRLKKRKLALKDEIARLESQTVPDIIA